MDADALVSQTSQARTEHRIQLETIRDHELRLFSVVQGVGFSLKGDDTYMLSHICVGARKTFRWFGLGNTPPSHGIAMAQKLDAAGVNTKSRRTLGSHRSCRTFTKPGRQHP